MPPRIESVAVQYQGLCQTCKQASRCTYTRDYAKPIRQCEEFEGDEEPRMKSAVEASSPVRPAAIECDCSKYKGLCRTCQKRDVCTFTRSPEGVWHCEEYV